MFIKEKIGNRENQREKNLTARNFTNQSPVPTKVSNILQEYMNFWYILIYFDFDIFPFSLFTHV